MAALAFMIALSTLLVIMHVDWVIQLGSCFMSSDVSSCVIPLRMSLVIGWYCLLSSALHLCPDGFVDGSLQKAATCLVCGMQSAAHIFVVNSWMRNENRKTHNVIFAWPMKIAGVATVILLSIFTKMMNQHFVKLKYLESESDSYERESSPSSPVRSLSSRRGGTGRGGVGTTCSGWEQGQRGICPP